MTTITLLPHAEKLAPPDALPAYHDTTPLLYHQVRTFEALQQTPLVMNTYPTGTGKTIAALLRLLDPEQHGHNTLFIAPTNALIDQHAADAQAFIERNQLDMQVIKVDAARLRPLMPGVRRGEVLQQLMHNYLAFNEQLGLPDDAERQPFVMVTNPDIFYLALFFQYAFYDQRNVFERFITRFKYIVIDEFHYYDNKQFANFLFFFALWKQWGYFETKRCKVCLLTATPRSNVYTYLDRIFPNHWTRVGPDNEPPESANLATTPALTELHLTIKAGTIDDWVKEHRDVVEAWQDAELDGAIISSSLGRINDINHVLRHLAPTRITGPEPAAKRQEVRPLILATPTVDIGYNFGRPGKARQSIDRLVCDARFGDELTQRIGRAGRVLGRQQTTQPSEAVVVVGDDAADELRAYDGKTLSREEWAAIVQGLSALPPKHQLEGYIRTQSIIESFYPIYQISRSSSGAAMLQELWTMICDVFAPNTTRKAWSLEAFFRVYDKHRQWLKKSETQRWSVQGRDGKDLADHFARYYSWLKSSHGQYVQCKGEQFTHALGDVLLNQPTQKAELGAFITSQVTLTKALLSFREAWQGPQAAIYDPQHLLSSETLSRYDIFHLIANYDLHVFDDQQAFERTGGPVESADMYVAIKGFRVPKWLVGFEYTSTRERDEFEERYCRSVVALQGLRLTAYNRDSKQRVRLLEKLCLAVEKQWIPCLIVGQESLGPLINTLRGSPFYSRDLEVDFDGRTVSYNMITGTAAFHVLPELKRHFSMQDKKLRDDAIIL